MPFSRKRRIRGSKDYGVGELARFTHSRLDTSTYLCYSYNIVKFNRIAHIFSPANHSIPSGYLRTPWLLQESVGDFNWTSRTRGDQPVNHQQILPRPQYSPPRPPSNRRSTQQIPLFIHHHGFRKAEIPT